MFKLTGNTKAPESSGMFSKFGPQVKNDKKPELVPIENETIMVFKPSPMNAPPQLPVQP
jgi:hypothetical protein